MGRGRSRRVSDNLHIIRGLDSHYTYLLDRLRRADREEILAAGYRHENDAIETSWKLSSMRWVIVWKSEAIGLFGVCPLPDYPNAGAVWMLGTDRIEEIKVSMVKVAGEYIKEMLQEYEVLCNYVHVDNKLAIKWLRHMKFNVSAVPEEPYDSGHSFYYFEIGRLGHV